jgi:hypothetical protein
VLLRVRLAHVGNGEGIGPDVPLRHGLDLQQVEREPGPVMNKTAADRFVGVVQIDRVGAKTMDRFAFCEAVKRIGTVLRK